MYRSLDEARQGIADWLDNTDCVGDPDTIIDSLLPTLLPVIGFDPASEARSGGTRFGGTPDLPPGTDWPIRLKPENFTTWTGLGHPTHSEHINKYLSRDFPFEFIAQVDCADFAGLAGLPKLLPEEGRLLFFYDLATGPWRDGEEVARVIWDRSPRETLTSAPEPPAFEEMRNLEREETLAAPNEYNFTREELLSFVPRFIHPSQPVSVHTMLQVVPSDSLEAKADVKLQTLLSTEDACGDTLLDYDYSELNYGRTGTRKHQMLGAPVPEQDDARYYAAALTPEGLAASEAAGDDWAASYAVHEKIAPDWTLLLQVGLAELQQGDAEGTLYFLIETAALKARAFDKTIAIYQQT